MNEYFQISLYLKTFSSLTVPQEQLSNIKDCLRKLAVKKEKESVKKFQNDPNQKESNVQTIKLMKK